MKLLIPGGAGYIGSHMVKHAIDEGHEPVVLDNFSTGNRWSVQDVECIEVDLLDKDKLSKSLKGKQFDGVIHFAAKSIVGESNKNPKKYYLNNVIGSINLFNELIKNDISKIVFSSTAAIFGNPQTKKISESHPINPINIYGKSKYMIEEILQDYSKAYGLQATCFRYFNAAGADPSGEIGEHHDPETHLIPNIIESALSELNLNIYGDDYPTHDGTCIRDYIHVNDIASSHLLGIYNMNNPTNLFKKYNLGNGSGFSVKEVIRSCEKIIGSKIQYNVTKRRDGDPVSLVADSSLAENELNWIKEYSDIDQIIETAYCWHLNKRNLF